MGIHMLINLHVTGIVSLVIGISALLAILFFFLYHYVFSRNSVRRQIKELERKYSYLDALLMGQDSGYIHRLEIISRTNLLYVEKYNDFATRFKEIFEGEDKFAESMIKQLKALVANKQFQHIKEVINDTKKAIASFETNVNELDKALYEIIKPEEEARLHVLKLKEDYRRIKQIFYANANDLELVTTSFTKVFDKLDNCFAEFENDIEGAQYDDANALIPVIDQVIHASDTALSELPNLCILTNAIVPEKIKQISDEYDDIESRGIPLFNLSFKHHVEKWNGELSEIKESLVNLKTAGAMKKLDNIQQEIKAMHESLINETNAKKEFNASCDNLYGEVIQLEKRFLKICAILPEIHGIYVISDEQEEKLEQLKINMNNLGQSKRMLDNFIHSGTKQPYSVLKSKLDELGSDYRAALEGVNAFKEYVDSLKKLSEEAYTMVFVYYYHIKQVEAMLKELNVVEFSKLYEEQIEQCYTLLNDLDIALKDKPINVSKINEKVKMLKEVANPFFDEVENKNREAQLAESTIVYANRDRNHQRDVHQQLSVLETAFFKGDFLKVYHDASGIFKKRHVEQRTDE